MHEAIALIGHAGSGTIATAVQLGKPLLVMPRVGANREHVNDQVATGAEVCVARLRVVGRNDR